MNNRKFIWQLETSYYVNNFNFVSNMFFTSKSKAITHAKHTCLYTLDGEFKVLSKTLLMADASKTETNESVRLTISREYLF